MDSKDSDTMVVDKKKMIEIIRIKKIETDLEKEIKKEIEKRDHLEVLEEVN